MVELLNTGNGLPKSTGFNCPMICDSSFKVCSMVASISSNIRNASTVILSGLITKGCICFADLIARINDSITLVQVPFRCTFAVAKFVNGKQFGKKNRLVVRAYSFVAFSERPMYCH